MEGRQASLELRAPSYERSRDPPDVFRGEHERLAPRAYPCLSRLLVDNDIRTIARRATSFGSDTDAERVAVDGAELQSRGTT